MSTLQWNNDIIKKGKSSCLTKFVCLVKCSVQFFLQQGELAILGQLGELCQVLHLKLDLQQVEIGSRAILNSIVVFRETAMLSWQYLPCVEPFKEVFESREADQPMTEVHMAATTPTFFKLLLQKGRSGREDALVR